MLGALIGARMPLHSALPDATAATHARVVIVHDTNATRAYEPQVGRVRRMVERGLTHVTGTTAVTDAWHSLLSTQDVVGLKVYTRPGPDIGTRLGVAEAVVETLLAAGLPPRHIVVWDKQRSDLRQAGYLALEQRHRIRVEGSTDAGFDPAVVYDPDIPLLGPQLWSDVDFGRSEEGSGRKSHVSRLVAHELTKIVIVSPLLNHYQIGVTGNLYSLALGSVDNTLRFDLNPHYLAQAVPEIYALPAVGDKVVLSIVDGLLCQYQGQHVGRLHYTTTLNELRFSKDPVALDRLSAETLAQQQRLSQSPVSPGNRDIFSNASLLELGVSDLAHILTERLQ